MAGQLDVPGAIEGAAQAAGLIAPPAPAPVVPFYTTEPAADGGELRARPVHSSTGEVLGATLGGALAGNPTAGLARESGRMAAEVGTFDEFGRPITAPEAPVPAADLESRYGIKGHLDFKRDMPESVARDLYDLKRAELE